MPGSKYCVDALWLLASTFTFNGAWIHTCCLIWIIWSRVEHCNLVGPNWSAWRFTKGFFWTHYQNITVSFDKHDRQQFVNKARETVTNSHNFYSYTWSIMTDNCMMSSWPLPGPNIYSCQPNQGLACRYTSSPFQVMTVCDLRSEHVNNPWIHEHRGDSWEDSSTS